MKEKHQRVIIDTNLWISFLISGKNIQLDRLLLSPQVILLFSRELLDEFLTVAKRPKFKRFFSSSDMEDLVGVIQLKAEFIKVVSKVSLCRDKKDDFLLSLSKDGEADFLITGDKDLLDLKTFGPTRILTISDFIQRNINRLT